MELNATLYNEAVKRNAAQGPLYRQLKSGISELIASGMLAAGASLPAERDLARMTGLSRVTVRKAMQELVATGEVVQKRGSGTYVAPVPKRMEQSLHDLTSFSDDMKRRGMAPRSIWLSRGLFAPTTDEMMSLAISMAELVARLERVRLADEMPMAIERASLPASILPDPEAVDQSLYALLRSRGINPVRAIQRISAINVTPKDAEILGIAAGAAVLKVERISYLASGRVAELTRSIYRGDAYDFAAELK